MTVTFTIAGIFLVLAALLSMFRMLRGPSTLDRLVALEMVASVSLSGMAAWAAFTQESAVLPALVALALLGFIGSISVPRFRVRDRG